MRGGKREGAGRKGHGLGKTKVYRLPIELEPQIMELLNKYKNKQVDSVTQSIGRVNTTNKPEFPILSNQQLDNFRKWLIVERFVKSPTAARKQTDTPKLCKETFLRCIHRASDDNNKYIIEIMEIYAID